MRHQAYACILKIIVSTSENNFNNSIKIAAENSIVGTLTSNKDSFTHVYVGKHHKNPQPIVKKLKTQRPQLHNKLAFNIFLVVPNFAKISTTVKIVKKRMQAKKVLSLKVQKQPFKSSTKQVVHDKLIKSHLEISASASRHW